MEAQMLNPIDPQNETLTNPNFDSDNQDWEAIARDWLSTFPVGKIVTPEEIEGWVQLKQETLPDHVKSMPRPELYQLITSIQSTIARPGEDKDVNQGDYSQARFQRTDQWLPVYTWLESIDSEEVIKSKDILDWLSANPDVKDDLYSRHSRYHLMHYIKKCHVKILKRKERKKGLPITNKANTEVVSKSEERKLAVPLPCSTMNNIPTDSDLYVAKRSEALRKYEILVDLEKQLSTLYPKPKLLNNKRFDGNYGSWIREVFKLLRYLFKKKWHYPISQPKVVAVSDSIKFVNPKAPLYPRLAQGKSWNEMTVTWRSGYNIDEAIAFVEWGMKGHSQRRSPAGTLTFHRNSMCGSPARTVGWRDPGFIHTSFLKELWPNVMYTYRMGHILSDGSYMEQELFIQIVPIPWSGFLAANYNIWRHGEERDGSNEYSNYQPGSLNTTYQLIKDLKNIDIVFHIGDLVYANGYISQWDQFTSQVEPIALTVPYMVASGNHERDWPGSGSFDDTTDSGGECGVLAETMFYVPAENRAKFWYSTDYGMFHFCIADTEHDWREGSDQYRYIEHCLASADRRKQPWLIFAVHRVLGYSSDKCYGLEGSFEEPMGRESLQRLWQKYKVDIAFYGHVHNYERSCPIYQNRCVNSEKSIYSGIVNGTIHVVGGGGSHLSAFSEVNTSWSVYKDYDFGFVKLTAFNHSSLLFEYKKSSDGVVYDLFTVSRDYKGVLACVHDSCVATTLAS